MCILLKLDYAKFGVSNLFFSQVIEEKPLRSRLDPLGKGRVKPNFKSYPYIPLLFMLCSISQAKTASQYSLFLNLITSIFCHFKRINAPYSAL